MIFLKYFFLGTRNDDQNDDPDFGEKFLGVKAGGSLEVHGPYKRSWTKLDGTLVPHQPTYRLRDSDTQPPRGIINTLSLFTIELPKI